MDRILINDIVAIIRKENRKPRILIFGMGSVATYLLDYLASSNFAEVTIATRNEDKAIGIVNCVKMAALIRTGSLLEVKVVKTDLENPKEVDTTLEFAKPDIVVNASRFLSHIKYGSISWNCCRAYGYWIPLSMYFTKKIGEAIMRTDTNAIFINTSYPDATNAWLVKGLGFNRPILGAGNVNHIMARYKNAFVTLWNKEHEASSLEAEDINVLLEAGHFHDVLIGKEGTDVDTKYPQTLAKQILVKVDLKNPCDDTLQKKIDSFANTRHAGILALCNIQFPSDATRNMMVASSAFEIIKTICSALDYPGPMANVKSFDPICEFIDIPGAFGNVGGNPIAFILNDNAKAYINKSAIFGVQDSYAQKVKLNSLYQDGLDVSELDKGYIKFVNEEKLNKLEKLLDFQFPKQLHYNEVEEFAQKLVQYVQLYLNN